MAFVVSQGQLAALSKPSFIGAGSIKITDDYSADYAALWRAHGSVRTVVDFLGRNIASLGLHVFERAGDADRKRRTDHPLAQLMAAPNSWTTRYDFFDSMVRDLAIYDRFLAVKIKAGTGKVALMRIPPTMFSPVGGTWFMAEAFEVRGSKGKTTYPSDQVVYIGGYSPEGDIGGVSSIESLRSVLAEEYEAALMRAQTFRNGARVSGYLKRPREAPAWTADARDRFKAGWRSQYNATGAQAGGTPVLEDGMDFIPASQSAKDLQYIESRKLTREEVASAYFIPPPMIGLLDKATFSNIKEQHKHLYQDTLGPWLQRIAQSLQLQLLGDFEDATDLYLEFNLEEKMRGSFEDQATQIQSATGGPWMTRNEARAMRNMPAIEGGDDLIVPLNVITGGQASPQDSGSQNVGGQAAAPRFQILKSRKADGYELKAPAPEEIPEDHQRATAKVFARFFARQRRSVLAAAGAKDPEWWDTDRWDEELAEDLLDESLGISEAAALAALAGMGVDAGKYSTERTRAFLKAMSARIARQVNAATLDALDHARADGGTEAMAHVFDVAEESRAEQSGMTAAAAFVGFGMVEAARQTRPQATKRWQVNSGNPRSSHSALSGEEVPIDETFSNGLEWPGGLGADADEVANCQCSVIITN
ncbi:portal protein [Arthrobacter phage Aoka]|nr:portal protein [Arthrobacter phage Aoka]